MGIDGAGTPHAVSPDPGHEPRLDRRRLVQGAVAASLVLVEVVGGAATPTTGRLAGATGHADALPPTAAARVETGDPAAGACLEATLHVMMQ